MTASLEDVVIRIPLWFAALPIPLPDERIGPGDGKHAMEDALVKSAPATHDGDGVVSALYAWKLEPTRQRDLDGTPVGRSHDEAKLILCQRCTIH